jgi:hypothetical protein
MCFHRKPVPLIRIIFLQTHPPVCRVAYGVAPVDSQKRSKWREKRKGRERRGKRAKNMWPTGKSEEDREAACVAGDKSGYAFRADISLTLPNSRA